MSSPWTPAVLAAVHNLLTGTHDDNPDHAAAAGAAHGAAGDGGASLSVFHPDGTLAVRAPMARSYRLDEDDPAVLWIRLVDGRIEPDEDEPGPVTYSLAIARRRNLAATAVHLEDDGPTPRVIADLRTGQRAVIEAAEGAQLAELADWDTFVLTVLPAADEEALAQLNEDSWHGEYA
jgi:hypothetical protein